MYIHYGDNAFSAFQLKKLPLEINSAKFIHIAELSAPLSDNQKQNLNDILGTTVSANKSDNLWVLPRFGTQSPWSSKATEIINQCGITKVVKIERGIAFQVTGDLQNAAKLLHDKMTESIILSLDDIKQLFIHKPPKALTEINILSDGEFALQQANIKFGLALNNNEIDYLLNEFVKLNRNPTDIELMMFAQANSEHCRHKIFNADWTINKENKSESLFMMIKNTYKNFHKGVLSAYSDNACVVEGYTANRFFSDKNHHYLSHSEPVHLVYKAETHNHPTAISPFAGAATGAGGEIRDGGATGRGAKPKAGIAGFSVSNLELATLPQPWEIKYGKPKHIQSALSIILDAPIGAAAFNNEFGRPVLGGYFRTLEILHNNMIRGYHKPIMLSAGWGNIRAQDVQKKPIPNGATIIILGGPAMLIGLGGGAASSMQSGKSDENLDFASVQRGNPEMERRVQEVIDACWSLGEHNPIISIHDVGAGGLSNAVPEIIHDCNLGGNFELRQINSAESQMSPLEIWCNEAQERYVIATKDVKLLEKLCKRERCPYAILGTATNQKTLKLSDKHFDNNSIDLPMDLLFGNTPKIHKTIIDTPSRKLIFKTNNLDLKDAISRVLHLPAVASKSFLITIADRSITGMVTRDQMVGKWQTPVSDTAVTVSDYHNFKGEAVSLGEKPLLALLSGAASARMAVAEAITNLASANIKSLEDVRFSANWMAASGIDSEDSTLYTAVKAVSVICQKLNICIPVGKDSMSMQTVWHDKTRQKSITSPLSLVISSFAPVIDVRKTLTPELKKDGVLLLIDLGNKQNRLGGSALAQVYKQIGDNPPDIDDPIQLQNLFNAIQQLNTDNKLLAYHDRSDGGVLISLLEMAFASHLGLNIQINSSNPIQDLFTEEAGVIIQISQDNLPGTLKILKEFNLEAQTTKIATIAENNNINIYNKGNLIFQGSRISLQKIWSKTSFEIQKLRDNPACAKSEFAQISDTDNNGIAVKINFDISEPPMINTKTKPPIAILREQGVNGQNEMAAAFDQAGFDCVDVHMSDLINNKITLTDFKGLVACGGFSYGDVLGAGNGWAKSILFHNKVRDEFEQFFNNPDTFSLGVCNGCQMLANLKSLIPGAKHFPQFVKNKSAQFESRFVSVEILKSPSLLLSEMQGSQIPIAVAHGEGLVHFENQDDKQKSVATICYVDNQGLPTETYPYNPNGSEGGLSGFTTTDGRVTIMMPHPERVFRTVQNSYHPDNWDNYAPWFQMFVNAYKMIN